jgi:glycosyltransferase involved in cell wall biosynthesis
MDLSFVVISRNEEAAIGACLEAILKRTTALKTEVILVDSASTDRTVEIAQRYPVTVVRIDECMELSPSAGRYLGTRRARGKYVFFLDGDMIVIDGWLEHALAQFEDPNVAAVGGSLYRVYPGEELNYDHKNRYHLGKVRYLAGSGVYRREVLGRAGTFNPFVKGEEERELGFRIIRAGHSILRLDVPMVFHMEKARTKAELDEKAKYFTGVGQIFRRYGLQGITRDLLAAHRSIFGFYLFGLCALLILVAFVAAGYLVTAGLMLAAGLLLGIPAILAKGRKKAYLFFRLRFRIMANIVKGFRRGIPDAAGFQAVTSVVSPLTAGDSAHGYHER